MISQLGNQIDEMFHKFNTKSSNMDEHLQGLLQAVEQRAQNDSSEMQKLWQLFDDVQKTRCDTIMDSVNKESEKHEGLYNRHSAATGNQTF